MTKQMYDKMLAAGIKTAMGKLDPQMIFSLASDVVSSYHDLKQLRIRGDIFLQALKEHEITVRHTMDKQTEQMKVVIHALTILAEKAENHEERMECLRTLATFGSEAVKTLGETSKIAFNSIPQLPGGSDK